MNSQSALGRGYTGAATKANTGATNSNTFCYGTSSSLTHIKFLGVEDMWGNLYSWLDGVYCDNNYNIKTDYRNSVFTGTTGDNFQFSESSDISSYQESGYIKAILGSNNTGFIRKGTENGTSLTYFADIAYVNSDKFAGYAGGNWDDSTAAGAFRLRLDVSALTLSSSLGARLMYKHLKEA